MRGATASVAGSRGIVPKPTAGQHNFMLLGDGTWGAQPVAGLPSQTSNSGKLLTTDGTNAAWTTTAVLTSLTSPASIDLTLAGGSSGASLVLGQGASGVGLLTVPDTNDTRALSLKQSTNTATAHLGLFSNSLYIGQNYYYSTGNVIPNAIRTSGAIVISTGTTANSGNIDFNLGTVNTAPSTLARLTGTGNLLIGTTTDMSGSAGLKVASTSASTGSTSGAIITPGGIYAGAASVFGSTLTTLGFILNRTNNSGVYTGTGDNFGFLWTGTNGEMSTATGSMIFKPAATTALTLTSTTATFAGAVTMNAGVKAIGFSATPGAGNINISNATYPTSGWAFRIPDNGSTINLSLDGAIGGYWQQVLGFDRSNAAATFAGAVSVSGTAATWTSGTGSPESVKTAPVGSLYTRTDGGASTTLYVKESGASNTGWIAK